MTDWREVTLGAVCALRAGSAFKTEEQGATTGDLPFIKVSDMNLPSNHSHIRTSNNWVTVGQAARLKLKPLPAGTSVFAKIGEALRQNRVRLLVQPTVVDNNMMGAIPNTDLVDPLFFFQLLRTVDFAATSAGTAVPYLTVGVLNRLPLRIPDLASQRRIAHTLGSIDHLIENNRRRIELLEEMARAIYREWFMHFRYPGLGTDGLVDSPLGQIPQGWRSEPLSGVATVVRGRSYRKHELVDEGGMPFVNLKCMMRGGGFRRDGLKRYEGKHTEAQLVTGGDVVLAVTDLTQGREILARATLVPRLADGPGVISLDVARIVADDPAQRLWIFAALRWSDFSERVKEFANGSTVLHLSPKYVEDAHLLWPPDHVRADFMARLDPMICMLDDLNDASDRLASIRNLLLPRLVTGRIDVSSLDLEALVEQGAA